MAQDEGGSGRPGPRPSIPVPAPTPPPPVVISRPPTPAPQAPAPIYYPSYGGGGGGGGGGGWSAPPPPDPNQYAGLPSQYVMGLRNFVGDPTAYYTSRGAEKQAQTDYYAMLNQWANRTGVSLTPDDWGNVWGGLGAYRTGYTVPGVERQWTFGDALNYLNRMLASAPQQPQIAYLKTGEI